MNSLIKTTQKYAIVVILVIAVTLIAVTGKSGSVNEGLGGVVGALEAVVFVSVPDALMGLWAFLAALPLVIVVLVGGAIFFTLRFNFINFIGFRHAIEVTLGRYDNPDDPGEVSHFQALSSALSATVGLGNIAGVAVAVTAGGPGAIFWMMMAAVFGMTSKFAECTLGQMYRKTDVHGAVQGGPMVYLRDGLAELGYPTLGRYLSVIFAILCIGGSFGGGNMFQANQSFEAMGQMLPWLQGQRAKGEVVLMAEQPVAFRAAADDVQLTFGRDPQDEDALVFVPSLAQGTTLWEVTPDQWVQTPGQGWTLNLPVVASKPGTAFNAQENKRFLGMNLKAEGTQVFAPVAGVRPLQALAPAGGVAHKGFWFGLLLVVLVGVVIVGGIKSIGKVAEKIVPIMCSIYLLAALWIILANVSMLDDALAVIWHEAFDPRAGLGGLLGVFVQGVRRAAFSSEAGVGSAAIAHSAAKTDEPVREGIVALLEPFIDTIVVCFMTGMVIVITGVYINPETSSLDGVSLTSAAFGSTISWFPYLLSVTVFMFAYSTMISWSYYGERCWTFLFGPEQSMIYRAIFLLFIVIGCVSSLENVIGFSDLMILSMAFPNIVGVVMLSGKIREALESYWSRYKNGEFKRYDQVEK